MTLNALWLPTTVTPHVKTLQYQREMLQIFNASNINQFKLDTNISFLFDWTKCSLQLLYVLIQKENAQRTLTQGDTSTWRSMFPIPHSSRIAINKPNVTCTPLWCIGTITCYLPKTTKMLCSFHTLPIIKGNYFLQPQIEGTFIDSSNVTYKLTGCVPTDRGLTCNGLLRIMEPCLLTHSVNLCILTVYPLVKFSVLYEVEPQHVCFASSNTAELLAMGLSSPYSGCLQHLEVLHWNSDVFYLVPDLQDDETLTWIPRSLRHPTT